MGGPYRFARPVFVTGQGPCSPRGFRQQWTDRAFDDLASEMKDPRRRGSRRRIRMNEIDEETIKQQQQWANRAFELAKEAAAGMASSAREEMKGNDEAIRRQEEWLKRAFGLASDVTSGYSSPRYDINDNDNMFQVTMDVPGVLLSDIDVAVEEEDDGRQVLKIRGQREIGSQKDEPRTIRFAKSFTLDPTVDSEKISAQLNNGVLVVSAPKVIAESEEKTKKIPVVQISDQDIPNESINETASKEVKVEAVEAELDSTADEKDTEDKMSNSEE